MTRFILESCYVNHVCVRRKRYAYFLMYSIVPTYVCMYMASRMLVCIASTYVSK